MEIGRIQLWQVPLLVMAAIALVEWVVATLLSRRAPRINWRLARALGFGAAVLIAAILLFVNYLSEADKLANVISAVASVATLWLTYRAFRRPGTNDTGQPPGTDRQPEEIGR